MADVTPPVPPDVWVAAWANVIAPAASAAAGLAMRYAERYRAGQVIAWRQLLIDTPTLLGAYFGGPGLADLMGWGQKAGNLVAIIVTYFGARLLDALWVRLQTKIIEKVPS